MHGQDPRVAEECAWRYVVLYPRAETAKWAVSALGYVFDALGYVIDYVAK